jgi:hypothetical protein
MFGQISNHENKFFISGQEVLGLENVSISYSNSYTPTRFVGVGTAHALVASPVEKSISMSRYLIYQDPVLNYTGDAAMSGSVNYRSNSYGFTSGYLTEYSINCAVGTVPNINSNIVVYGEMRTGVNQSGSVTAPTIHIPNQGSISLTADNSTTNRVVGFDYGIKISRTPIYKIGSQFPTEVIKPLGADFTASVQIDVDDAFAANAHNFLSTRENKTVIFTVRSRDLSTVLQTFTLPNASIVSETLTSSADGGVKLTINYAGQI